MSIKDQIRAEIERLEGENNCGTSDFIEAKRIAYNQVKKVLDTIPEQPSLPSDLDEAAERIVVSLVPTFGQKYEDGSYVQGTRDYFSRDELIGLVKAGAEWMAERLKR